MTEAIFCKKFKKHAVGDVVPFPDIYTKILVKAGFADYPENAPKKRGRKKKQQYETRELRADTEE